MQCTVQLARDAMQITSRLSPPNAARHALEAAIAEINAGTAEPTLASEPPTDGQDVRMWLTAAMVAWIQERDTDALGVARFAERLIDAYLARRRQLAPVAPVAAAAPIAALPLRANQASMAQQIYERMRNGSVVLAEAATGMGKTWVMAAVTAALRESGRSVTIAVPSVAVMTQFVQTFRHLGLPAPAPLLGRQQFVDPVRLAAVLVWIGPEIDPAQRQALEAWQGEPLDAGALNALGLPEGARPWFYDDLRRIAPDFAEDVAIQRESEHDTVYAHLHEAARANPVRIVTHALLAADLRLRILNPDTDIVPRSDMLIVDEAHALEDTIASCFSDAVSFQSLRVSLLQARATDIVNLGKKGLRTACDALIDALTDVTHAFAGVQGHIFEQSPDNDAHVATLAPLRTASEALLPLLRKFERKRYPGIDARGAIQALERFIENAGPSVVTLSPVRRYPRIHVGPRSLRRSLTALWEQYQAAALLSATLFVDTVENGYSAAFIAMRLAIPPARMTETPPLADTWVYDTAEVFMPDVHQAPAFIPPQQDDEEGDRHDRPDAERAYYAAIAGVIRHAAGGAGGCLVLCTSHHAVAMLARELSDLGERLLVSQRGNSTHATRREYIDRHDRGLRPVWLATGPAWTGLDLRDARVAPSEDALLTDLVVTRLPFMPPRTASAVLRRISRRLVDVRIEAAIAMRQGIGRLVRSPGLRNRRIFITDGRLASPVQGHRHVVAPIERALRRYPRRGRLPLDTSPQPPAQ